MIRFSWLLLLLSVGFCSGSLAAEAENAKELVAKLYAAQNANESPLAHPGDKEKLGVFFDSTLSGLIVKDQKEAGEEVGRLDFDPIYDAQDTEIQDFKIAPPKVNDDATEVVVTFKNMGEPQQIVFVLRETESGTRISDIRYADGRTLKKILQADL